MTSRVDIADSLLQVPKINNTTSGEQSESDLLISVQVMHVLCCLDSSLYPNVPILDTQYLDAGMTLGHFIMGKPPTEFLDINVVQCLDMYPYWHLNRSIGNIVHACLANETLLQALDIAAIFVTFFIGFSFQLDALVPLCTCYVDNKVYCCQSC